VLALTFFYVGFILYRLIPHHQASVSLPRRNRADIDSVQRDLCSLAAAEVRIQHLTGHFASLHDLRSDGKTSLPPDSRWPYIYVLDTPTSDEFTIRAVSAEPTGDLPPIFTIDEQMQVQTHTKPPRIYACQLADTTRNQHQ